LVARDEEGKIMSVRCEVVNAILLNEFLKDHKKVEQQGRDRANAEADCNPRVRS
jgi:hypothetical protein